MLNIVKKFMMFGILLLGFMMALSVLAITTNLLNEALKKVNEGSRFESQIYTETLIYFFFICLVSITAMYTCFELFPDINIKSILKKKKSVEN